MNELENNETQLLESWDHFCAELKSMRREILRKQGGHTDALNEQPKAVDLLAQLPNDVQLVSPMQRRAQIAERRRGVSKRFPY